MTASILGERRTPFTSSLQETFDPVINPVIDTTTVALKRIQQTVHVISPTLDSAEQAKSLLSDIMSVETKNRIIAIFNTIPPNERKTFVRDVQLLLPDPMQDCVDEDKQLCILGSLAKMSANERKVFMQNAKFLIPPEQNIHDEAEIIVELAQIPGSEQEAFAKNLKFLIPASMKAIDDQSYIIAALAKIPANEREAFVQNVKSLIPDLMKPLDDVSKIMSLLAAIPRNEQRAFVQSIECLIPNSTKRRGDTTEIMRLLTTIPTNERGAFVHNAQLLISDVMDGFDRKFSIYMLQRVPANERDVRVKNVKSLILNSDHREMPRRHIMLLMLNSSADEQEVILQYAKLLISDSMNNGHRVNIIEILQDRNCSPDKKLVKIPANELEAFAKNVQLLTPKSIESVSDKLNIIQTLAKFSLHEREVFVQNALFLATELTNDARRSDYIMQLGAIPFDQQIDFIKTYKKSLNINSDFLKAFVKHQESLVPEPNLKEPTIEEILATGPEVMLPLELHHLRPKHQEMLKKAIKIRDYYNKNGYICFLHGQEPNRVILQMLMKEIAKIRNPEKHFKDPFVFFRSKKYYEQNAKATDDFATQLKKTIVDDHAQRDEVMSVDAYFANTSRGESANDWCMGAQSVTPLLGKGSNDFDPLLEGISSGTLFTIKQKITDLMKLFSHKAPCGNLYVVAIPADKVMKYSYPAKPLGEYCDCRSQQETFQQLIEANHGKEPRCKKGAITQWRLAAAALRPENGVRSFAITQYSDLQPFIQEYIQPLAAQIVLAQIKSSKRTSRL